MHLRSLFLLPLAPLAAMLLIPACTKAKPAAASLDAMDSALINGAVTGGNGATKTLAGAIKVDPNIVTHDTVPHAAGDRPATVTLAEVAQRQAEHKPALPQGEAPAATGSSSSSDDPAASYGLAYSSDWATKLPAGLPLMPGAALQEAAGRDTPAPMRVVSFAAPGDRSAILAWYATRAKAAGYTASRADRGGDMVLSGDGPKGDSYIIMVGGTTAGRTSVDYVWTHG